MTIDALTPALALADRYRIDRELGAGGIATVYLAEDVRHHRKVALEVLQPDCGEVCRYAVGHLGLLGICAFWHLCCSAFAPSGFCAPSHFFST